MRPILASVLVLAFARGALAAGVPTAGSEYCSVYDYANTVTFVVNHDGDTVTDFPLFVRLSEGSPSGFRYDSIRNRRADGLPADLRFFDARGQSLTYEIETWDEKGESRFWVQVPILRAGTEVTMCWNLRDGCSLPTLEDAKTIWKDYVGVWHFGETITSAEAATTLSADATGNGHVARPVTYASGASDLRNQTYSGAGVFGNARHNSYNATSAASSATALTKGCRFELDDSAALKLGTNFTVTGWFKSVRVQGGTSLNGAILVARKTNQNVANGWYLQMQTSNNAAEAQKMLYAQGAGNASADSAKVKISDEKFQEAGWTFMAVTYSGTNVFISGGNKAFYSEKAAFKTAPTDNGQKISIGNFTGNTANVASFDGYFDEFRIRLGTVTNAYLYAEFAQGTNAHFCAAGTVVADPDAVLKNSWSRLPSASQTTWDADAGERPVLADFDLGKARHCQGNQVIVFYDRATGECLGTNAVPLAVGDYRAVVVLDAGVDQGATWGALEQSIDFRIVSGGGRHALGKGFDRILLFNDDYTVADGEVVWQSYSDEIDSDDTPFWRHLDENGADASSTPPSPDDADDWSVSYDFNLGGGTRHAYYFGPAPEEPKGPDDENPKPVRTWLWFMDGVRIGNTFNNGAYVSEYGDAGLQENQNYLPWNYDSQRVIGHTEWPVDGWHRYAGQAVMQNKTGACLVSPCYTNGIGTVYFDAVNGWADNVRDEDGKPCYQLKLQIATQTKPDKDGKTHPPLVQNTSSNPEFGTGAYDPYYYADWQDVPMHVLRFDDGVCTSLGVCAALDLTVTNGASCAHFYRVYAPITNTASYMVFRLVRTAIDKTYDSSPDGNAYLLVDNVICSSPTPTARLEPYGTNFAAKVGRQVLGCEGAFNPPFPAVDDTAVSGRAKATLNGRSVPAGAVTAATMHYRWHYLGQKTTDWKAADLDLATYVTIRPLELPPFLGDIEFWYDLNQGGDYYEYADYSGTGLGLAGLYSEAIPSVTNRASGANWFVRQREGKSDIAEMKLVVRGEKKTFAPVDLYLTQDGLWRGFLRTTNVVEGGVYWRIEPRNRQTPGATEWAWNTNYWYVAEWDKSGDKLPTFPAAGRMSEGDANSWSRLPIEAQTGHLMFQLDENLLGLTIARADYQDFNDWNSTHGQYFVGSFSDPKGVAKKGSSGSVRTYDEQYGTWPDTSAYNTNWTLTLDGKIGDPGYPGYETFSGFSPYYGGWNIGKGMWVYGKYREVQSQVALQMAGCGEGFAELANSEGMLKDDWPRGIGTVSFKARIAQQISPLYASYFDQGSRKKDYGFMTYACFDRRKNEGFSGDAALSLFAYYRAGVGAYEARWEQISGKKGTNKLYPNEVLAPDPRGQRLVISRWDAVGSTYKETVLFTANNDSSFINRDMPKMPYNNSALTNNLMPFCLSVYNHKGTNIIVAAVRIATATESASVKGGVDWNEAITSKNNNWYVVFACDTSPQMLKGGTYGVLSSNCEGMFLKPQYNEKAVRPTDVSWDSMLNTKAKTGKYSNKQLADISGFGSCSDDVPFWEVDPGRMSAVASLDYWEEVIPTSPYGFAFAPPHQTVDVYTRPRTGTGAWSKIGQVDVDGFGTPGLEPDCAKFVGYAPDCHVRLQTGGGLDDYRVDVAIDDIVVGQWRGEDNWSTKASESTSVRNQYGRTNIVYTTGWVADGAVRLSAKRSVAGTATSVRSPLFDGIDGRGIGLGMIGIRYREPQKNIRLKVQIVTNYTWQSGTSLKNMSLSVTEGNGNGTWHTITNLDYEVLHSSECWDETTKTGWWRTGSELGLHAAQGLMRIVVDNALVKEVANETDPAKFGEIDILEVVCKDEPALDKGCWWGWNMLTLGDPYDKQHRMYLPDAPTRSVGLCGQSFALNNSVSEDVSPAESPEDVCKHMPFLQSPTFTNAVIGQISFKARKYDLSDLAPAAEVVVYGATRREVEELQKDSDWQYVASFPITNTLYTTYTCKTDSQSYYALRLAVVGVKGTLNPPVQPATYLPAQRVLIDEVSISEAVRATLAFRGVGAFRSNLDDTTVVTGVTTSVQQPLCDENWGVQAEVYPTMLGDEIDSAFTPRVKLHWYVGAEPWGYENWKKLPADKKTRSRGSAYLSRADGTNLIYRSSYKTSPDAIMPAQKDPTVVQYMLEVEYRTVNSTMPGVPTKTFATNWLDGAAWSTPAWYAPVDYNADPAYGAGKTFAAFTILDTVAPGWAWVNEMNVFGVRKSGGGNSEQASQFLEVCAPAEADLTGWKVRLLDAYTNGKVITNNVATFGTGRLTGRKKDNLNMKYGKVFRAIGTKEGEGMRSADGTFDAPWVFSKTTGTFVKGDGYYYIGDYEQPFGVQLLRPSGIIEHSIVVIGTNRWGRLPGTQSYDPTNFVAILNANVPGSRFFYAGEDCAGEKRTDSVMCGQGASADVWTNDWRFTAGKINLSADGTQEQVIGDHPSPHGDSIIVYASLDTVVGHIRHRVGNDELTTDPQMIILKRGSDVGTNITYLASPWYEVASVTTNGAPLWHYERCQREVKVTVGVGASNNLYVVGAAQVDSDLADRYGLDKKNPFTPAVMDWLENGWTLKGKFSDPGKIYLADYQDGTVETNLTLTQMYCLDIDPTVSNQLLKTWYEWLGHAYRRDHALTNDKLRVSMMITNRNTAAAWSPYVLRGLEPGSHSWQYKSDPEWAKTNKTISSWTSETFKVTGILWNGHTSVDNPANWIPLNWFVFHEDSFYQPDDEPEHTRFTTEIEILDPHCQSSPGADVGWYDWCRKNRWVPVFYRWAIDLRLRPVAVEVLKPNNFWDDSAD